MTATIITLPAIRIERISDSTEIKVKLKRIDLRRLQRCAAQCGVDVEQAAADIIAGELRPRKRRR
jgi:hypothetical protein